MSQETRFARTRAELQKFLDEIAYLSRSDLTVENYLSRFLQLTLNAIGCQGGAMWMVQGNDFQRACSAKFAESEYDTDEVQRSSIQTALRDAAQNRRPVVVGPMDADAAIQEPKPNAIINHTAFPFFFVPIIVAEISGASSVLAVLQVWAPSQVDPKAYRDFVAYLQETAKQAAVFLRARRIESLASSTDKLQQLLRLATEVNGQTDQEALAIAVVNWGREITGCDRCALFGYRPNGKLQALAVSGVEVVDQKSSLVQAQHDLAEDTLRANQPSLYRKSAPKTEALGDLSDYFFHSHANEALGIPLAGRDGKKAGVLLIEAHRDRQLDENTRKLSLAVAVQVGRSLGAAQAVATIPFIDSLRHCQRVKEKLKANPRKWLIVKVGLPIAVALVVAMLPWPFSIRGDCTILPVKRAVAVAEVSGRVVAVLVREGDTVVAGQPLARLDDAEVRQTLVIAAQEKAKAEAEADRLQVLGDDGGRKISLIHAAQVQREIDQWQRRLAKTQITSPINGVILTKDLPARVGEVLVVGHRFCDIGDLSRWEAAVQVSEAEVALLSDRLRQGHPLAVSVLLHSMSDRPLTAVVRDEQAISQASSQLMHENVFLVRAEIDATPALQQELKAGYTGCGKLQLGWRPGIYLATRKFVDYFRIRWLF